MINLIRENGPQAVDISKLSCTVEKVKRQCSRATLKPDMHGLLMRYLDLSSEEADKICEKYGEYAGSADYLCQRLGMDRDEAYEKGIVPWSKPIDKCDAEHRTILDEYRRIRLEKGIKAANEYFLDANAKMVS